MQATFHRSTRPRPVATLIVLVVAGLVLAGCSELAGALGSATPTPADTNAVSFPSAGPETPIPISATPAPAAASPGSGGHAGSHAIVCIQPITPGGGGPPCVPVTDALVVAAAMDALTPAERAAVSGSGYVAGSAACSAALQPAGCTAPDVPVGVVTFHLEAGAADVRVLVYRGPDGALGATRMG